MKRFFANLLLLVGLAVSAAAGEPAIKFDETTHDFGNIHQAKGTAQCEFTYTNTGTAPLVIITVSSPCDCTTTSFSPKPLAPGKSETIKVTYNPTGRTGEFSSLITVRTNQRDKNGKKKKETLRISGVVIPTK